MRLAVIPGDGIGIEVTEQARARARRGACPASRRRTTTSARRAGTAPARRCPTRVLEELRGARRDPARRGRRPVRAVRRARARAAAAGCASRSTTTSTCARPSSTRASRRRWPATRRSTSSSCARAPRARTRATAASLRKGTPHEIATEVSVNTAYGVERVVRDAFARAQARPRKHLTLVHKNNVLTNAGDLWFRTVQQVGAEFPDVTVAYNHVDAATIYLVTDPGPLRRDRHRQPVRRHHHRPRRRDRRRHRPGRERQPRRQPHEPVDVRAGARLGAGHRRPGQGRPDRGGAVGGDAARARRRGRRRARGSRRRSPPISPPRPAGSPGTTAEIGERLAKARRRVMARAHVLWHTRAVQHFVSIIIE